MRRVLVFQHVAWEILGTLLPLLKDGGLRIKHVNFGRTPDLVPRLDRYGGLIVLGGPMSANDTVGHPHLETEVRLIGEALERGLPVLGICLGAQLLARALGAEVRPSAAPEIGWYDVERTDAGSCDPLFAGFGPRARVFQWHGDTFDLPRGAEQLARAPGCEQQAFRFGDLAWGLQFHLEVDPPLIERWLGVPQFRAQVESLAGVDPEAIRRESGERDASNRARADLVFGAFLERLGAAPRRRSRHPHG